MSDLAIPSLDSRTVASLLGPEPSVVSRSLRAFDMGAGPKPSIDETLEEFQAIFLNEMMKSMREALPESGLFEGEELSRETFQSLLDQEYVRTAAHQMGGLGLTEALKWQLGLAGTAPTASQPPKEAAA